MRWLTTLLIICIVCIEGFTQSNISLNYGYCSNDNKAKSNTFNTNGSQFICGEFSGELIQGFNYINQPKKSVFILKENTQNDVEWVNHFYSTAAISVNAIAVKNEYLVVVGMFSDSLIIFDDTIKSIGQKSMYIAFFDTLGVYQSIYVPSSHSSEIFDLSITNDLKLYATGEYYQNLTLGTFSQNSPLGSNMFLFCLDIPTMQIDWLEVSVGIATNGKNLDIDELGNIHVVGSYGNNTTFSGLVLPNVSGDHNLFIAKYTKNGDIKWVKAITGNVQTHGIGVACSKTGDIYFTGEFEMLLDLPDQSTFNAIGGMDAVVGKLDSNGVFIWAKHFGSLNSDNGEEIIIDSIGNPILLINGGAFSNINGQNISTNGFTEPLIIKLNQTNGDLIWKKRLNALAPAGIVEAYSISKHNEKISICGSNRTGLVYGNDTINSPNFDDSYWFTFRDTLSPITNLSVNNIQNIEFQIFPNPATKMVSIKSNENITQIMIFNLSGQLIKSIKTNQNVLVLDLQSINNLCNGTYIFNIETNYKNYTNKLVNYEN